MADSKQLLAIRVDPALIAAVDAVAPSRGRTKWIVAAINEKLSRDPQEALQEARESTVAQSGVPANDSPPAATGLAEGGVIEQDMAPTVGEVPGAGFTAAPATCAHIVLGAPEPTDSGLVIRRCRGCGEPVVS